MAKLNVEGLAERLKIARTRMIPELLQRDVGKILNRSAPCIGQWEAGKTEPRLSDLVALSELYKVSIEWLLGIDSAKARITEATIMSIASDAITLSNVVPVLHSIDVAAWNTTTASRFAQTAAAWPQGQAAGWVVDTDAMSPACGHGDIAVVERGAEQVHGGIYLVLSAGSTKPTLRRCQSDQGEVFFVAEKSGFTSFSQFDATIIGRVRETIRHNQI